MTWMSVNVKMGLKLCCWKLASRMCVWAILMLVSVGAIPTPLPISPPSPPTSRRPQLVDTELLLLSQKVGTSSAERVYDYTQMTLMFNQPLYLNMPLLCTKAELPCEPQDCVPCDFTGFVEVLSFLLRILLFLLSLSSHPCCPAIHVLSGMLRSSVFR
jgi:hypothetical protein